VTEMSATKSRTQADDRNAIRPSHVNVPEAELTELRSRINSTRWPEQELVADATQGVQLATVQALARYWGTEYDRRKVPKAVTSRRGNSRNSFANRFAPASDHCERVLVGRMPSEQSTKRPKQAAEFTTPLVTGRSSEGGRLCNSSRVLDLPGI
jgi:hypothetical protein